MQGLRSAHLATLALALVLAVLEVACGAAATPMPAATPTKAPLAATATLVPTPTAVSPTATPTLAPTPTPVPPTPTVPPTKPPPTATPTTSLLIATPAPTPTKPPPSATPAPFQVTITNFALPNITIPVGTAITWRNDDSVAHTATSGKDGQFDGTGWDSPALSTGQTFSLILTRPGAFAYTCFFHPFMNATVTVSQSGAPSFTLPTPGSGRSSGY